MARQGGPDLEWAVDLSRTLNSVIFAFLVGGLTVSIAYTEFIYMAVMLMEILKQEVQRVLNEKRESSEALSAQPIALMQGPL